MVESGSVFSKLDAQTTQQFLNWARLAFAAYENILKSKPTVPYVEYDAVV